MCLEPSRSFAWRVGTHPRRRNVVPSAAGLTPDHVPQLFWQQAHEVLLSGLVSGAGDFRARWFCSATLIQLCGFHS